MKNLHQISAVSLTDDQKYAVIRWRKAWDGKRQIRFRNGYLETYHKFTAKWDRLSDYNLIGWAALGRNHHTIDEFREDMLVP